MSNFDRTIDHILEMTTGVMMGSGGSNKQPVSGEYGNSLQNNDFYAKGDARIPCGPKKRKKKRKYLKETLAQYFVSNKQINQAYPNKKFRFKEQYNGSANMDQIAENLNDFVNRIVKWNATKNMKYDLDLNIPHILHSIRVNKEEDKTIHVGVALEPHQRLRLFWSLDEEPMFALEQ